LREPTSTRSRQRRRRVGPAIGACSLLAVPATAQADDFTVENLNNSGNGSLRDAVVDANLNPGADRVLFQSKLSGTITLASEVAINETLDVVGPDARRLTISGGDSTRIFYVATPVGSDVTVSGLTLTAGDAAPGTGGAIFNDGADLTVSSAVISGNSGGQGAVEAFDGSLTIRNSSLYDNESIGYSGGAVAGLVPITISNSTLSDNHSNADAGAIVIFGAPLVVRSSTVTGNEADDEGGGIKAYNSDVDLIGTIVANNTAASQPDISVGAGGSFGGVFSLIEEPAGVPISGSGHVTGQDPKLGALKDNGGPTPTHDLGKGSPAKNAGPTSGAPATDQRGAPRKGRADIGAYEMVKCGGNLVDVVGTPGKDRLRGDGGRNGILGLGGNDRLSGVQNRDGLCGAGGKDKLIGGSGRDKLLGGGGKDLLKGGKAADKLNGGPGNDRCVGGSGPGNDKFKSC
jgi:hypothetical protein